MKMRSLASSCILVTLTLGLCLSGIARQGGQAAKAQTHASLDASLDQIERGLKDGAAVNPGYRSQQVTRVRLKRSGGCQVSFQVSLTPGTLSERYPYAPVNDIDTREMVVNLSELDAAGVELIKPNRGDFTIVGFSTLGGKEAIRVKGYGVYDSGRVAASRISVSKKAAPQVAEALRQAITACKQ